MLLHAWPSHSPFPSTHISKETPPDAPSRDLCLAFLCARAPSAAVAAAADVGRRFASRTSIFTPTGPHILVQHPRTPIRMTHPHHLKLPIPLPPSPLRPLKLVVRACVRACTYSQGKEQQLVK